MCDEATSVTFYESLLQMEGNKSVTDFTFKELVCFVFLLVCFLIFSVFILAKAHQLLLAAASYLA